MPNQPKSFFLQEVNGTRMFDVLNKYLLQHKSISIPGLGSLVAEPIPAISDFTNKRLLPVQTRFRFDKYFDAPDREFFIYLSHQKNIADFEAIKWYNEFAYELRNTIRTAGTATWEGIGVFRKEAGGDIVFEPLAQRYEMFAPVNAERVIRADAQHTVLVGDKETTTTAMAELLSEDVHVEKESWWIYALLLAAIGLIVLVLNLYRSDINRGFTGNRQGVEVTTPAK